MPKREEPVIPNRPWKRYTEGDKLGLIEGFEYPYKANGAIDWDKLVSPKYLIYPNDDYGRDPMIKVDGLRDVAEIRGIAAKDMEIQAVSERLIICKVRILFIPTIFEPQGRIWEGAADASPENINGRAFGRYLTACAETRAMGRCIKEALGIRMLMQEEVSDQPDLEDNAPITDEVLAAIDRQSMLKGKTTLLADIQKKYPNIKGLSDLSRGQGATILQWLNAMNNAKQE